MRATRILSVKLIVKMNVRSEGSARAGGVRCGVGAGPLPCHRYKSRGFTRTRAPLEFIRRFYLRILLFVSLLLVPIENFYVCMRQGACPRKVTTCERFTATITQFSSKRSLFIGLWSNNLTLLTPVNIFVCMA